ncbi:hypothetical protein B0H10DRAFT_2235271 [Mycena sp. CBHHK59/15]|nr:hypothetical protein B0H10DRAFT_2235271 [Mycena sp. CBHHK59/15]
MPATFSVFCVRLFSPRQIVLRLVIWAVSAQPFIRMPPSATFSNIPLSTSFEPALERSTVSLDWVLNSGLSTSDSLLSGRLCIPYRDTSDSLCSLRVHLHVSASLPFDLVLGRDWFHLCCTSFSTASFYLSSGVVDFSSLPNVPPAPQPSTAPAATEAIDTLPGILSSGLGGIFVEDYDPIRALYHFS